MAENDQEKTEYQSQKKLEQSREKGELPRSQELATFTVFAIVLIYFSMARLSPLDSLGELTRDMLRFDRHMNVTRETLLEFLMRPILHGMTVLAPLLGLILVLSPLVTMSQTGFNIARDKLTPDWNRLNPISGIQRFTSAQQWIEGLKSCLKIGLFGWLSWLTLSKAVPGLTMLATKDVRGQLMEMLSLVLAVGTRIAVLMATLAVLDYGYQWWQFQKRMRMTQQEMKEEMKEREGNPLIKQRQRSLAMQRARQRMMAAVPKASVVVTNPTHYAVALSYDKEMGPAPLVCAKGQQMMAQRIKALAREHNVPVIENKPLARALYRNVKVGQVIPNEFFKAVAEVLAFVYWLKHPRR